MSERKAIMKARPELSITRQCQLLAVPRSSAYTRPQHVAEVDVKLMRRIDNLYLKWPFSGSRRLRDARQGQEYRVSRKRVQRLMRQMGLRAVHPKPLTSQPEKGHKISPSRLRDLSITRPNQLWAGDICYIPMAKGFMYLTVIMDWSSRRVLAWRVSNTLETEAGLSALDEALTRYGAPEMFNTDQSAQYISETFTMVLKTHGITIRMDGKGRWVDHVFVERLWQRKRRGCLSTTR